MPSNYIHWSNRTFATCKPEASYGVDPSPVAVDLLELYEFSKNFDFEVVTRPVNKANISPSKSFSGKKAVEISFKVPLWASNSTIATTAGLPRYARLLRACSMSQAFTTNVKCLWAPSSEQPASTETTPDSLTFYILDTPGDTTGEGTVHEVNGAVGSVKFVFGNSAIPYMEFTFKGFYNAPVVFNTTSHPYSGSEETILEMIWRSQTITVQRDGDGDGTPETTIGMGPTTSYEIDIANNIVAREDCTTASGYAGFLIAGRNPTVKTNPERDVPGAYSFESDIIDEIAHSLVVEFGDSGPRGKITANPFSWVAAPPGERDGGLGTFELEGNCYGDDNEFEFFLDCS